MDGSGLSWWRGSCWPPLCRVRERPGPGPRRAATSSPPTHTLTADLTCAGDGLVVAAPGVTLDLGGHTISGPGSRANSIGTGVRVAAAGVTVRNGTIQGFRDGLDSVGAGTLVTGLRLLRTGSGARFASDGNRFQGNLVVDTGTGVHLQGDANVVEGNALRRTGNGVVVASGSGNRVVGNSVVGDGDPDIGIFVFSFSAETEVSGNSVSGQPGSTGIRSVRFDSRVTGNQVFGNLDGIVAGSALVADNTAFANGELGIRGGRDGGGNRAFANGDPRQCDEVRCSP